MSLFAWDVLPTLATSQLLLRPLQDSDAHELFAIYGDVEVMRFASEPVFPSINFIPDMLASVHTMFQEHEALAWGIVLRATAKVIGVCEIHHFTPQRDQAEVGCMLMQHYWGQRIMYEALQAVITFGFTQLELMTLQADIDVGNNRSVALFKRLGFTPLPHSAILYELHAHNR